MPFQKTFKHVVELFEANAITDKSITHNDSISY